MLLVEGSEYIKSNNHIGFVRIVYKWAYTHWRRKSVAGQSTLIILTPNSYKHVVCGLIYTAKCFKLNSSNCQLNCYSIDYTQKWGEDMLAVCSSFKKIKPPWSSAMRKWVKETLRAAIQEDWQLVWWRRWTRLLRCVIVPLHTKKEKCCWSNLRPLTRRISSNTTTFSSSIYSTRYGRGFRTVVGCACVCVFVSSFFLIFGGLFF
jgi:hypothetical protein